mgnify:CR=1 FL=1
MWGALAGEGMVDGNLEMLELAFLTQGDQSETSYFEDPQCSSTLFFEDQLQ